MKRILGIIVTLIMILITCIGFSSSTASFLFAEGSDCLLSMAKPNIYFQLLLTVLFGIVLLIKKERFKRCKVMILMAIFLFWFLSGRVIGHFPYPEEKIINGWFYFQTSRTCICDTRENEHCENVGLYETSIGKLPFWRIRVKNKEIDTIIFVGPFIWKETLILLEKRYPSDF